MLVLFMDIIMVRKHHDQKQVGKEKVLLKAVRAETKRGQELDTGTDAQKMEELSLLACSSWLVRGAFLWHPGPSAQKWHQK